MKDYYKLVDTECADCKFYNASTVEEWGFCEIKLIENKLKNKISHDEGVLLSLVQKIKWGINLKHCEDYKKNEA